MRTGKNAEKASEYVEANSDRISAQYKRFNQKIRFNQSIAKLVRASEAFVRQKSNSLKLKS